MTGLMRPDGEEAVGAGVLRACLNIRTQALQPDMAELLLAFQQPQAIAHDFARVVVSARGNLGLDEFLEVRTQGNAGGHGDLGQILD